MNDASFQRNEEFSQLFIDGMGDEVREFVPIIYGQTVDEICKEWQFNRDAELQNIILKLYYEVKNHEKILCSMSGGYDSDISIFHILSHLMSISNAVALRNPLIWLDSAARIWYKIDTHEGVVAGSSCGRSTCWSAGTWSALINETHVWRSAVHGISARRGGVWLFFSVR